ncbi:unnamed protein product [Heligmosomoides polygyrus]|uniref:Protein-tyrosine-phosphatase n=1 Tax=Heligmosomoides polygyrus TaxID=6339 RepID=A0A183F4G5_HELPZ|nr:unnamed protein product [Heligmosomoides polygyrus]
MLKIGYAFKEGSLPSLPTCHSVYLQITHVLTVSAVAVPLERRLPNIDYHFIFAMDLPNQDLLGGGQLLEGIGYITRAVQSGGNVLVHCEIGVSRSATVVAAYVMQKLRYSARKAVEFVKISRPLICPNEGFFTQLQIFEAMHYKADESALSECRMYKDWCVSSGNVPNNGQFVELFDELAGGIAGYAMQWACSGSPLSVYKRKKHEDLIRGQTPIQSRITPCNFLFVFGFFQLRCCHLQSYFSRYLCCSVPPKGGFDTGVHTKFCALTFLTKFFNGKFSLNFVKKHN